MKKVKQLAWVLITLAGMGACMSGVKSWLELSDDAFRQLFSKY